MTSASLFLRMALEQAITLLSPRQPPPPLRFLATLSADNGRSCPAGKRHNKTHTLCRRCGRRSYHIQKSKCSSCGYPAARIRKCESTVPPVLLSSVPPCGLRARGRAGCEPYLRWCRVASGTVLPALWQMTASKDGPWLASAERMLAAAVSRPPGRGQVALSARLGVGGRASLCPSAVRGFQPA